MSAMFGMVGTGRWDNEEIDVTYRQGILYLYPNGDVPLTSMTSKGKNIKVNSPEFYWWDQGLETQGGAVTATSGSGAHTAGNTITCTVSAATAGHFRVGHAAKLLDKDNTSLDTYGKVTAVVVNGDSSTVTVQLKTASSAAILAAIDYIDIVGSIHPEGAPRPDSISYKPTKYDNVTQIFRTPLSITRTQMETKMRTEQQYQKAKKDALLYHGIEFEQALIEGEYSEDTDGSQAERTSRGLLSFINTYASDNVIDFPSSTALTWKQGGEDWLDESLEQIFREGSQDRLALCGSAAMLGMVKLIKNAGLYTLEKADVGYGIRTMAWMTPFGTIHLKHAPLMTKKSYRRNQMLITSPENITIRYITDTKFKASKEIEESSASGYDARMEEYLTEAGFEIHHPTTHALFTGIGVDGTA